MNGSLGGEDEDEDGENRGLKPPLQPPPLPPRPPRPQSGEAGAPVSTAKDEAAKAAGLAESWRK